MKSTRKVNYTPFNINRHFKQKLAYVAKKLTCIIHENDWLISANRLV